MQSLVKRHDISTQRDEGDEFNSWDEIGSSYVLIHLLRNRSYLLRLIHLLLP